MHPTLCSQHASHIPMIEYSVLVSTRQSRFGISRRRRLLRSSWGTPKPSVEYNCRMRDHSSSLTRWITRLESGMCDPSCRMGRDSSRSSKMLSMAMIRISSELGGHLMARPSHQETQTGNLTLLPLDTQTCTFWAKSNRFVISYPYNYAQSKTLSHPTPRLL
jgi:hypothetical protein